MMVRSGVWGCGGRMGPIAPEVWEKQFKAHFPSPRHPPHPSKCGGHAIVCTAETDVIF